MLKDYTQLVKGITNTPWLITQEGLETIVEVVNMRLDGRAFSDQEIRIRLDAVKAENENKRGNPNIQIGGGVGVMPLYGSIFPKSNLMTALSGATSLEAFTSDLRELVANPDVSQIVLDIDSPGGVADMVAETGTVIKELSAQKPIYAVANTMAGSAAFWLLSQATKAYGTQSGKVGSLGVYTVHEDHSVANEKSGVKTTYISAGRYKTAGNPNEPLSSDAREYIQESVDDAYDMFVEAVASGRGKTTEYVLENFGQGKMFRSAKAAEVGMIDGVMSMNQLLNKLVAENATQGHPSQPTGELAHAVHRMKAQLFTGGINLADPQSFSEPGSVQPNDDLNPDTSYPDRYDTRPADEDGTTPRRSDTVTGAPQHTNDDKGGEEMDDAQLNALMSELGITSSGDSEKDHAAVLAAVGTINAELAPLRELKAAASRNAEFATQFPDEAKRMARLEQRERAVDAKAFAGKYANARLHRVVGDKDQITTLGFSANVIEGIEQLAVGFAEGNATQEMLSNLLDSLTTKGLVDFSNVGSSRENDNEIEVPNNSTDARKAFGDKVTALMVEDGLSAEVATETAAKKYPDLFAAYMQPVRA